MYNMYSRMKQLIHRIHNNLNIIILFQTRHILYNNTNLYNHNKLSVFKHVFVYKIGCKTRNIQEERTV